VHQALVRDRGVGGLTHMMAWFGKGG
jgi:hypothetical protein